MVEGAGRTEARFDAADFLMAHLHFKPVLVEQEKRIFQRGPDRSDSAFPVLLLENLRRGQFFSSVRLLVRCLDPELQLRRGCQHQFFDVVRAVDGQFFADVRILLQQRHQVLFERLDGIPQDDTAADFLRLVMDEEGRNSERTGRKAGLVVHMAVVLIDIPVDMHVRDDIDLGIVQCRDPREHNAGAVRLDAVLQHLLHILQKSSGWDLFICIVPADIDADERNKAHFRMLRQCQLDLRQTVFVCRDRE